MWDSHKARCAACLQAENFINEPAKKDRLPGILEGLDTKLGSMSDLYLAGSFSICDVAVGCYLFFIPKICPEVWLQSPRVTNSLLGPCARFACR